MNLVLYRCGSRVNVEVGYEVVNDAAEASGGGGVVVVMTMIYLSRVVSLRCGGGDGGCGGCGDERLNRVVSV